MNRVMLASILLIILLITLTGLEFYLNKTFGQLNNQGQKIKDLVESGNWYEAMIEANILKEKFIKIDKKCSMFIHHHQLKNIESAIDKSIIYIKNQDTVGFLIENSNLLTEIKHLTDEESPVLKNIL